MKNKLTLLLLCLALTIAGCSKDGAVGPQGPQGEKGDQGIPGKDGSSVLSGRGVPAASLGKDGDFYIDLQAGILYGPKASNAWTNSFSMVGKDGEKGQDGADGEDGANGQPGANGKDGAKMISGQWRPSLDDGEVGDFYFETTNALMYGPKTANTWGDPVSLRSSSAGARAIIYRNIQTLDDSNGQTAYSLTRPFFYYRTGFYLNNTNLMKGVTYYFWNFVNPDGAPREITSDNYASFTWTESVPNGPQTWYTDQETGNTYNFRLEMSGASYLTIFLVGEARNSSGGAADPQLFHNFLNKAKFNILIQHIPYSSIEIMKAQNIDINNQDQVKRFLRMK